MLNITPPSPSQHPAYYQRYIDLVKQSNLIDALRINAESMDGFFKSLPYERFDFRYAPDKWSVKEVLLHVIDCERIFAYRALRFSRNDKTPLPGFDENTYAPESFAAKRSAESIHDEYKAVREATIQLFNNFSPEQLDRSGISNNNEMSVRSFGYAIAGHEIHHLNVLKEKYL